MKQGNHNPFKIRHCGPWILTVLAILTSPVQADGGGTYSVYDTDRDGYLDRQEFIPFVESRRRIGQSDGFWQFDHVDQDGDQKISEKEMVDALIRSIKIGK